MIMLVDMDAFFASVEQAHHPHLRGKALIVCGDPSRRGVVTAASYEARPSGVRAGMPLAEARRLCPDAEYVEGNPRKYVEKSLELLEMFLTITPDVEPFSVDEAFLDLRRLPGRGQTLESASEIARELQQRISDTHGLGASMGIGPNKLIAKMASGVKKPRGITALSEDAFRGVFWPQDVQALWGVGPKLSEHLKSLGLDTVGALAHAPAELLKQRFGVVGEHLREAAWGRDRTPVIPYHEGVDPKSMGHEVTLPEDCRDPEFLEGTLLRLSDQVARRLRGDGFRGRTVTVKLRDFRFRTLTRQRALGVAVDDHTGIFEVARALWREHWKGEPLRLLGVSVSALEHASEAQLELFAGDERTRALQDALDQVRDKLGEASVVPAGSLAHRRALGHVTFGAPKRVEERKVRGGYARGADPSAPDPTQLKPRLPADGGPGSARGRSREPGRDEP
ncbi:MAG TPA: DNA polymerase IV [Candidatus Eisenbacteria bacterium]|jgi:DNA polymerase-4